MSEDDENFVQSVLYFYTEKNDPTRYSCWDADRCERLMPAFFYAWRSRQQAQVVLDAVVASLL